MSYHDFTPDTREGKIGQSIYLKALDDRRCFRYDQLGIDDDEIWTEIFEAIGREAIAAAVGKMTDAQIKFMVDRFLGWELPANFNPDAGISYVRPLYAAHSRS